MKKPKLSTIIFLFETDGIPGQGPRAAVTWVEKGPRVINDRRFPRTYDVTVSCRPDIFIRTAGQANLTNSCRFLSEAINETKK